MTRMTLELTPEANEALEALVTDLSAASKAEAIRRAIALTVTVTRLRKDGFRIAALDEQGQVSHLIVFP